MSQWTHIAGIIRIDAIPGFTSLTTTEIQRRLENNLPQGSEGPAKYKIELTGDLYSITWIAIFIWADLRDYKDHQAIFKWIQGICDGLLIRSCCVKIEIEFKGKYIITEKYNDPEIQLVMLDITKEVVNGTQ